VIYDRELDWALDWALWNVMVMAFNSSLASGMERMGNTVAVPNVECIQSFLNAREHQYIS
jgi:hypothetical protein